MLCPLRPQGCFIMKVNTMKNHRLLEFFKTICLYKEILSKNISLQDFHFLRDQVDKVFVEGFRKGFFSMPRKHSVMCCILGAKALSLCIPPAKFYVTFMTDICTIWLGFLSLKALPLVQVDISTFPCWSAVFCKL